MSPCVRLWPLPLLVLLSGAAAFFSQTPEPPGAVIYDRHWPYMAPGGDASWRWPPQRQRQRQRFSWRRETRAGLAPTGPEQLDGASAQERGRQQEQEQELSVQQGESQDRDRSGEHVQSQVEQEQDRQLVQEQLYRWPEFLRTAAGSEDAPSEVLSRQRRKHGRPQQWKMQRLCEERGECACYSPKTRATFCCDCQWGSCFPSAASALLPGGRSRRMDLLTAGERVMTVDSAGRLVPTTVLGFLDRRPATSGEYLQLHLSSGHRLQLSASHVTFSRGRPDGLFASEVRPGDELLTEAGNGTAVYSPVQNVTRHIMTGAFVPLTEHGTLLVDGVLASNYASFSHHLSHMLTTPFRVWPALLSDWFIIGEKNVLVGGLKSLGKMLVETPASEVMRLASP